MGSPTRSKYLNGFGAGACGLLFAFLFGVSLWILLLGTPPAAASPNQTVLDLQRGRVSTTVDVIRSGKPPGRATLINLNPAINLWWVLQVTNADGTTEWYHLENPFPESQHADLREDGGLVLVLPEGEPERRCALWQSTLESPLLAARKSGRPFGDLCGGHLFLRNPTAGRKTKKEWAADLLRDRFRHGERITTFVKEKFFRDKYRRTGEYRTQPEVGTATDEGSRPSPILMNPRTSAGTLTTPDLNIRLAQSSDGVVPGRWYSIADYSGIFVSALTPQLVADEVVRDQKDRVNALDSKESSALVYLVAFDLSMFDVGFALGTEHPRVDWSDRVADDLRGPSLPGPDGFDNLAPLVRTGILSPHDVPRAAATFAGGFKRSHGAFKWGELATVNQGSHYGLIESGVVLSTLQPGLSTLIVFADGRVEMKTWRASDSPTAKLIRHARQNGVPLVETDPATGLTRPGGLVQDWGKGNWSGSETKQLRTLRAGAGLQESEAGRFLIYGYFSTATPSAMARVFQACGCTYAMHLDMNAPEHTYLAIYRIEESYFVVQRLVKEMAEVDPPVDGKEVPRFVGYPDNRDFFYLLRREAGAQSP